MSLILNKLLRIAIADDHPIVLNALKQEFSHVPEFRVVLTAQTGEALLDALQRTPCEVVISDFAMPTDEKDHADGFVLIKRIRAGFPSTKLIVYTAMNNSAVVRRLYRMGVFAVISKKEKANELVSACLATQSNKQMYFPLSLRGELEVSWAQGDAFAPNKELTMSELEVVRLFVSGSSLSDICDCLSRTPSTVSTHKNNAMRKLGLTTDADLIKYAYTTGMI